MVKIGLNFKSISKWLSAESLTKKASLNAVASSLDYGARLGIGFIIQPLLVGGLGSYLYGVWQILGRLIGYISAASGRPAQALKWTIATQQTSTNYEEKRHNVGSAIAVWLLFSPLLAALGGLLAWFTPYLLDVPVESFWSVRWATGLLVANLIMSSLAEVPRSVLQGENLGYKRMGLSAILVFVGGGFTALALYLNTGLVGVAAAELAITLLTGALFLQIVRVYAPWFGFARPSLAVMRRFLNLSWWFLAWRWVIQLMIVSDVVVLGVFDSIEKVTAYSLTKYIPETIISFVAIVVLAVTPGLGGIIGAGNLQKAARVRGEIMAVTWFIASVVGTTVLLWNRAFMSLWVGEEYYAGPAASMLITLMVMQFVLIRNDANIIDLTLDLRRKVFLGALSAITSLIVAAILVGSFNWGVTGLCLGFIAGRSILSLSYPWIIGRFLGVSLFSQIKSVLKPSVVTILLFILVLRVDDFLKASTWIGLILSVAVTLVVVSLPAFYIGFSSDQRHHILQRFRLVIRPAKLN